jgi:hypothetical protein
MGPEHSGFIIIIVVLIVLMLQRQQRQAVICKKINDRRKEKGEKNPMEELAKNFLGKECIVYTLNNQIECVVKEVSGGAILVEKKGTLEAVNLDFVTRIREFPRNKNGKKKSVVLD